MGSTDAARSHGGVWRGLALSLAFVGIVGCSASSCCTSQVTNPPTGGSSSGGPALPPSGPCAALSETQAHAAAVAALAKLPQTIKPAQAAALGFSSPAELQNAKPGTPFCVFTIPLDVLANYDVATSPPVHKLLVESHALYPIEVNGQVRSSMIVEKLLGTWQVTALGGPKSIQTFTARRKGLAGGRPLADAFLVKAAGLDVVLLGFDKSEAITLAATGDLPEAKLDLQNPQASGRSVLANLQPFAKKTLAALKPPIP